MKQTEVIDQMKAFMGDAPVEIPPKSFSDLGAEIIDYIDGSSITVQIPLFEKYNNPAGMILGGYLPTFFDLAFGPLSFLVAQKPTTSLDLNTTFINPIFSKDTAVKIEATVISKSNSYLVLEGKAYNLKGQLVATATSKMHIFK